MTGAAGKPLLALGSDLVEHFLAAGARLLEYALDALQFGFGLGVQVPRFGFTLHRLLQLLLGLQAAGAGLFDLLAGLTAQLAKRLAGLGLDLLA